MKFGTFMNTATIVLIWTPLLYNFYGWAFPGPVVKAYRSRPNQPFWMDAEINGKKTFAMLDTGSSDVAMSLKAARRAGMRHTGKMATYEIANGRLTQCLQGLVTVRVGKVVVSDVAASACPEGPNQVLLGQSFMSRFRVTTDHTPVAKLEYLGD
jgi:clan AA aspartic protease (TIGR02281 family)